MLQVRLVNPQLFVLKAAPVNNGEGCFCFLFFSEGRSSGGGSGTGEKKVHHVEAGGWVDSEIFMSYI